jgi:hypothetical protein
MFGGPPRRENIIYPREDERVIGYVIIIKKHINNNNQKYMALNKVGEAEREEKKIKTAIIPSLAVCHHNIPYIYNNRSFSSFSSSIPLFHLYI